MRPGASAVALAALLALSLASAHSQATAAPAATASEASVALQALFKRSDEDSLRRNPLQALSRGDMRYADRLGDYFSDASYEEARQAARHELAALARIDRAALSPDEQVAYDVFKWDRETELQGLEGEVFRASVVLPIDHFNGFHTDFADLSSGESIAPYKTVADYENGLKRIADFERAIDGSIDRMRQGLAAGIVQPKLIMTNVVEQLDAMLAEGVEGSSFYRPLTKFPAEVPAADQARLKTAYAQAISARIRP